MDDKSRRQVNREVSTRESGRQTARRIILSLTTIVVILLLIRFFFRLASANDANGFVNLIYSVTAPLIWPFDTIFPNFTVEGFIGTGILEINTIIAVVIWGILGAIIARLVGPARREVVTEVSQSEHRDRNIRP